MNKADEKELAGLHGVVSMILKAQLLQKSPVENFDADGELIETNEMVYDAPPALIAQAIKFLKDNDITCDKELDENLGALEEALSKKQKHSRLKDGAADASTGVH